MAGEKKKSVADQVREMALEVTNELGITLWDVQYLKEGADWVLRITIDKDGGINIDDCVDVTHGITPKLDERDLISREYSLEVTSPGANRRLLRQEHLLRSLNQEIYLKLLKATPEGEKEFTGILSDVFEDESFNVTLNEEITMNVFLKECAIIRRNDFK